MAIPSFVRRGWGGRNVPLPLLTSPYKGEECEGHNMTLWKGRFRGEMSDAMKVLNNSLRVDIHLLPFDVKLNEVWAEELLEI